ncbi:uncharacterized protein [Clytia hemisphaerica]
MMMKFYAVLLVLQYLATRTESRNIETDIKLLHKLVLDLIDVEMNLLKYEEVNSIDSTENKKSIFHRHSLSSKSNFRENDNAELSYQNVVCYHLNFQHGGYGFANKIPSFFNKKKTKYVDAKQLKRYQILSPDPKWTQTEVKKYHQVIMKLRSHISKIDDSKALFSIKKLVAKLLKLPEPKFQSSISLTNNDQKRSFSNQVSSTCFQKETKDHNGRLYRACGYCKTTKDLINKLPEKIIEITCNHGDESSCFSSFGECVQKHRFVTVLKKTGKCIKLLNSPNIWVDEWILHDELVGASCQCELNSLNFLKG